MSSICRYSSNPDNDCYFMVSVKEELIKLIVLDQIEEDVKVMINHMVYDFCRYEIENKLENPLEKVAVRKDSILGNYMMNHEEIFHNEDHDITYCKIVDAFNIAIEEDDEKMSNKLMPLFKSGISGIVEDFSLFPEKVINYILENNDFWYHRESKTGNYQFLVYEDGTYQRKSLKDEKGASKYKAFEGNS